MPHPIPQHDTESSDKGLGCAWSWKPKRFTIEEGWRTLWWYFLKQDPNLESLHDEPEYQAMIAEIEADMTAQLARVREMEKNGELESIPEVPATTQ